MQFIIERGKKNESISLFYRENEYSFDTEPIPESGYTSVLVNDLQLEIDEEGKILYIWGFCPLTQYIETRDSPKNYSFHNLIALLPKEVTPGISIRINEANRWPIYMNKDEGWICLGDPITTNKNLIEFSPNCIASLDAKSELTALWLKPKIIHKAPK